MKRETWTVEETAQILGIGRIHAYRCVKDGKIPVIRMGKRLLVPKAALQLMLEGKEYKDDAKRGATGPEGTK